jgi:hypothetical protein
MYIFFENNKINYLVFFFSLFTVVIHAVTTEITENTNVEIVNSSIEVQQSSNISSTSPDYIPSSSSLTPPTNTNDTDYDKVPIYTCHEIGPCVPCDVFEVVIY